jgi:hypothetical protein
MGMTEALKKFIQKHRDEIDTISGGQDDDEHRRLWVLNEETLFFQAIGEGAICLERDR